MFYKGSSTVARESVVTHGCFPSLSASEKFAHTEHRQEAALSELVLKQDHLNRDAVIISEQ